MFETSGGPWPGMQLSYLSKLGCLGITRNLKQMEVLGPKCSRVVQYLKYSMVSRGSYTPWCGLILCQQFFCFFVVLLK